NICYKKTKSCKYIKKEAVFFRTASFLYYSRSRLLCLFIGSSQPFVGRVSGLGICFGLLEVFLSNFREGLLQGSIAYFTSQEILEGFGRLFRIQDKRILAFFSQLWIKSVQVPVT